MLIQNLSQKISKVILTRLKVSSIVNFKANRWWVKSNLSRWWRKKTKKWTNWKANLPWSPRRTASNPSRATTRAAQSYILKHQVQEEQPRTDARHRIRIFPQMNSTRVCWMRNSLPSLRQESLLSTTTREIRTFRRYLLIMRPWKILDISASLAKRMMRNLLVVSQLKSEKKIY